jgi:hypothetical protein
MAADTFEGVMDHFMSQIPFKPFTVALVNGDRYEIDHPRAVAMRDGFVVFVSPGKVPVAFDHESVSQVIGDLVDRPAGE